MNKENKKINIRIIYYIGLVIGLISSFLLELFGIVPMNIGYFTCDAFFITIVVCSIGMLIVFLYPSYFKY